MRPISKGFFGGNLITPANTTRRVQMQMPDSLSDFTRYFEKGLELARKSVPDKRVKTPVRNEFWDEFIDPTMIQSNRRGKPHEVDYFLSQPEF